MSTHNAGGRAPGRSYVFADHQAPDGGRDNSRICRPGTADVRRPSFKKGKTTIRILPCLSPENPAVFDPYRRGPGPGQFGDWIRRYDVFRGGDPYISYVVRDPSDESVDAAMSPSAVLFRGIKDAIDKKQERPGWGSLIKGQVGKGAQLSNVSTAYLVTAWILENEGTMQNPAIGFDPGQPLVVMDLSVSAGMKMLGLFNELRPGYNGPDNDFEAMMLHGDPVSLQYGRYVSFVNPEIAAAQAAYQGPQAVYQAVDRSRQFQGGGNQQFKGYDVSVADNFMSVPANITHFEGQVRAKARFWNDIIWLPSFDEQAMWLSTRMPADAIMYGWQDHPQWITDEVRQRAAAAHHVAMGGYGGPVMPGMGQGAQAPAPGGYYPQQGQPVYPPVTGQPPQQGQPAQPAQPNPFGQPAPAGFDPSQAGFAPPPGMQPQQQPQYQAQPPQAYQPPVQQPLAAAPFGPPPGAQPMQQPLQQQPTQQPYQQPVQQQPAGHPFGPPQGMQPQAQQVAPQPAYQPLPQQPVQQPLPFGAPQGMQPQPMQQPQDLAVPAGAIPPQQVYQQPVQQQPVQQQPMQQQPVYQQPVQQVPPNPFGNMPGNAPPNGQPALDALARARAANGGH